MAQTYVLKKLNFSNEMIPLENLKGVAVTFNQKIR